MHFYDHLFCVPLGWGAAVCLLDIQTYDGKNYLALVLGDDHLILNGGAWQILSDQNIYSQL